MMRPGLALTLVAAALVPFCALGTGGALRPRADFAFCNQADPGSLDPALATTIPEGRVLTALFEGLTRLDGRTLEARPGVARSWEVRDDGRRWTFQLRPEARWSQGDRVTAGDFVYSFRRLLDPATASRSAYLLWCVRGAEAFTKGHGPAKAVAIHAPSDTTLVLELMRPEPELLRLAAYPPLMPVHPPTVERHGTAWVRTEHLVGNGPFRLIERRLGDRIRMVRSDTYWGRDEVALSSVDAWSSNQLTTQLNLYLTGAVDWIVKPPPGLTDALSARPDWHSGPQLGTSFLRFNTTRPPLDDRRVRRALALCLDRDALAEDVMRGGQRGIDSFVPPGLPGYRPAALPPPDPEAARRWLAEAGFPGGRGLRPIELLHPHNAATRDLCEAIAASWRDELGVVAHPVTQPWKVYLDTTTTLRYDVASSNWIGDTLDAKNFLEVFLGDGGNNRTGWRDARYDAAVAAAAAEASLPARAAGFRRAEAILLDALPIAPLFQRVNINMVAPRVLGFSDNLLDLHPLRDLSVATPP